jgi:hypothetical protein
MVLLYGRAGRLTAKNGGFRPLVPPPVWSTIYLPLQKVTSPRSTILNGFRPGQGALKVLGLESEAQDYAPPREIVDALSAEGQVRKVPYYMCSLIQPLIQTSI